MKTVRKHQTPIVALALSTVLMAASAPPLPQGLQSPSSQETSPAAPSLPPGLGGTGPAPRNTSQSPDRQNLTLSGFVEGRTGIRARDDRTQRRFSAAELRLQLSGDYETGFADFRLSGDMVADAIDGPQGFDLQGGRGNFDLREAYAAFQPAPFLDVKAGRQILTWGVGDLLFINDLFPKDFRAFFIGRDEEYLKAPSDALRLSAFTDIVNVELVYTPRFQADRFVDGTRLSYYNPSLGTIAGRNAVIRSGTPSTWLQDDEISARLYTDIGTWETAAYGYHGFWKTPEGADSTGTPLHPRLSVVGASVRGPLSNGILTTEIGHYYSHDDRDGVDPLIRNSETRLLIGYEQEAARELTIGGQYYAEVLSDHSALRQNLAPGQTAPDRTRHVLTLRVTQLLLDQNLILSAFTFWSPNEEDGYTRLRATYKLADNWQVDVGGNLFYGAENRTFFGQMEDNSNLFAGIRRSF